jgi:hypothetical protein
LPAKCRRNYSLALPIGEEPVDFSVEALFCGAV